MYSSAFVILYMAKLLDTVYYSSVSITSAHTLIVWPDGMEFAQHHHSHCYLPYSETVKLE
jgi:hypothetical protein